MKSTKLHFKVKIQKMKKDDGTQLMASHNIKQSLQQDFHLEISF